MGNCTSPKAVGLRRAGPDAPTPGVVGPFSGRDGAAFAYFDGGEPGCRATAGDGHRLVAVGGFDQEKNRRPFLGYRRRAVAELDFAFGAADSDGKFVRAQRTNGEEPPFGFQTLRRRRPWRRRRRGFFRAAGGRWPSGFDDQRR